MPVHDIVYAEPASLPKKDAMGRKLFEIGARRWLSKSNGLCGSRDVHARFSAIDREERKPYTHGVAKRPAQSPEFHFSVFHAEQYTTSSRLFQLLQ